VAGATLRGHRAHDRARPRRRADLGAEGRKGGYGLDRNLTLPPLSLTAEEALAIIVALRSATGWARRV
jgi:predicted DNA-binding transcriptional regulator YafY